MLYWISIYYVVNGLAKGIKTTLTATGLWIKHHARMHTLVALLVFVIGLSATLYYWQNLHQSVDAELNAAYNRQVEAITRGMDSRIQLYDNFLRGSAGLFSIHSNLTQAEWNKYHEPYDMQKHFPDVEGIGVSRYLKKAEVPAYLENRAEAGEQNFTIFPAGERAVYAPITFDAPYTGNKGGNKGYDTYTDPVRRKAMDKAVETGKLVMSGKLRLVSESRPNRSSFTLYLPVYGNGLSSVSPADRWKSLVGFAYIAVDHATFTNAVLNANQNPHIALRIKDVEAGASTMVYESTNFARIREQKSAKVETRNVNLSGHNWQMTFAASPELISVRERQLPEQALWRGLVTCIFFAGLVWYLITDRERKYARQKQEEVQTAKDDLLSLASHQLRTPATVVKQYVGMLLQGYGGKLSKQQMDMLDNAYNSNERQLEIINQLLYVARLDAGRITLHTRKVDIVTLLREVVRDQNEIINARQQQLTLKLPNRSLTLEADPHYLRMVFENLLSNAVKYTPEGGVIILEVHRILNELAIQVKDNGVGIDPVVQKTIFEKFTRIENELSNDVNGSGVGLYLTKQIVELHGGTITVKSQRNKGSTFIVHLPLHPPKHSGPRPEPPLSG